LNRLLFFFATLLFYLIIISEGYAQESGFGNIVLDEFARRKAITESDKQDLGIFLRSMDKSPGELFFRKDSSSIEKKILEL